ncbi:MAG: nitroreductase family protein [Thermoplasmata archaeon]|nr:nitroreductase family protein [Thermoplasmata archaeon]
MDFFEVVRRRRSIRRFRKEEVPQESVDRMLKAAFKAPSSRGRRPWHFIVVKDREMLERLSQAKQGGGAKGLEEASVGIVLVAEERRSGVWVEDLSVAATYLLLSATALGLGSFWIQIRGRYRENGESSEEYVKDLLGIPPGYRVLSIIAVGLPGEVKEPHGEDEYIPEQVHQERW